MQGIKKWDLRWLKVLLPILIVALIVPMVFVFGGCGTESNERAANLRGTTFKLTSITHISHTNPATAIALSKVPAPATNQEIKFEGEDDKYLISFTPLSLGAVVPESWTSTVFKNTEPPILAGIRKAAVNFKLSGDQVQWNGGGGWQGGIGSLSGDDKTITITLQSDTVFNGIVPRVRLVFTKA